MISPGENIVQSSGRWQDAVALPSTTGGSHNAVLFVVVLVLVVVAAIALVVNKRR